MISAIPPPRPVSVNSLTRNPISPALSVHKTASRCTSADVQIHDEPELTMPTSAAVDCNTSPDTEMEDSQVPQEAEAQIQRRSDLQFENLPIEIHEAILDHLFGERASTQTSASSGKPSAQSWVKALRHPRRKALSNLALISRVWRPLVQDRIYRHIKVKGTKDGLAECEQWFREHPHLIPYVRHIEVWVPVWGNRANKNATPHLPPPRRYMNEDTGLADVAAVLQATMAGWDDSDHQHSGSNWNYYMASQNATLEEIFRHVKMFYPEARILTLEGGHCKKPPLIRHFANDPSGLTGRSRLEVLPNIQTFVMRGAWNIMRDYRHWRSLADALPSLREWHCAYAKPKIEGYETIAKALTNLSSTIIHLNISLEGFHNKEVSQSHWFSESGPQHLCRLLGEIAPRLECLTFTGNVCASFFSSARAVMANRSGEARLKSLDFVVKTCCRETTRSESMPAMLDEAAGITNLKFIRSFEKLVLGAVRALDTFLALDYIRIRFIDLDSACPLLNPYFQMVKNQCTGLWSEAILETLHEVRPTAQFVELADGIYPQYGMNDTIIGAVYPRSRPLSINASSYKIIADAAKS
ncbi:hypothetical protein VTN77DRAFT_9879 [Rasamsonia byssochlamydoides]|uniref:uncharacterized protein n=1 Tax=Rasamsonia byssochlamydoides TaxID=89139 RepID=UPI003742A30A